MPYKSDKINIAGTKYDRRRKLSVRQHEAIRVLHDHGFSYGELADIFKCAKSTIQNIIAPVERNWKPKITKEYAAASRRRIRQYKNQLFKAGKIKL